MRAQSSRRKEQENVIAAAAPSDRTLSIRRQGVDLHMENGLKGRKRRNYRRGKRLLRAHQGLIFRFFLAATKKSPLQLIPTSVPKLVKMFIIAYTDA
jgi:hypothetical protein